MVLHVLVEWPISWDAGAWPNNTRLLPKMEFYRCGSLHTFFAFFFFFFPFFALFPFPLSLSTACVAWMYPSPWQRKQTWTYHLEVLELFPHQLVHRQPDFTLQLNSAQPDMKHVLSNNELVYASCRPIRLNSLHFKNTCELSQDCTRMCFCLITRRAAKWPTFSLQLLGVDYNRDSKCSTPMWTWWFVTWSYERL